MNQSKEGQSEALTTFYRAIDQWVKSGCGKHEVFDNVGLCCNLEMWSYRQFDDSVCEALERELKQQFITADLDCNYPFSSMAEYELRLWKDTMYECPKRLAWIAERCDYPPVADRLNDAEKE